MPEKEKILFANLTMTENRVSRFSQQKQPVGRCTIENVNVKLSLQEGKNEIMIALANYLYGWSIARSISNCGREI
jgi:hypothetical protein